MKYDSKKSDIFSLGMVVLHAGLMSPNDDCYDYKTFEYKPQILSQKLA